MELLGDAPLLLINDAFALATAVTALRVLAKAGKLMELLSLDCLVLASGEGGAASAEELDSVTNPSELKIASDKVI